MVIMLLFEKQNGENFITYKIRMNDIRSPFAPPMNVFYFLRKSRTR